ncbi:MAG: sulfur reduction protein DsrE [Proteobacteria bacterium]|nr:sulfur reduction protein DsrE [Pseudomonadota bacterium]MBU4295918.1 sulfur reduction protein DsrE [Pseudomonadota bacterium]MCG2747779.1 sulfur reduction protein DsrE [Desulfobulbaceae bacterium]
MNITLIACSDNSEILWNVFRMGNLMLEKMDEVNIFLNGPSVSYAALSTKEFPILELAKLFTLSEGVLLA